MSTKQMERDKDNFFVYKAQADEDEEDEVDQELETQLLGYKLRFPIVYLGDGYYAFGLKKVFIKILMQSLVVKVGTGYLPFNEFMDIYYEKEANHLEELAMNQHKTVEDLVKEFVLKLEQEE